MARKLRIQYPGAVYHVMNRGDRREAIFLDDRDRRRFLETLAEACAKTTWQVHAYCLMPNHVHLVVDASAQSGGRDEMVFRHVHGAVQSAAQTLRTSVQRPLPGRTIAAHFKNRGDLPAIR